MHPQCRDSSFPRFFSPRYLCSADITFERLVNCSARVTETYVFPYTTGRREHHAIERFEGQQLSDLKVWREGREIDFWFNYDDNLGRALVIPTEQNSSPVQYTFSYSLLNAVMRFNKSCSQAFGTMNATSNVLRWNSGKWRKKLDKVTVRFVNVFPNTTMVPMGDVTGARKGELVTSLTAVSDGTDVYVEELGAPTCRQELVCSTAAWWMNMFTIALVAFLWVGCSCCLGRAVKDINVREALRRRLARQRRQTSAGSTSNGEARLGTARGSDVDKSNYGAVDDGTDEDDGEGAPSSGIL